jgi:hypothetical protein
MSTIFSIHEKLSSTYWRPVEFKTIDENFSFKKTPILFDNGVQFYFHEFLSNSLDFSFNRRTGTILSNLSINTAILENSEDFNIKNSLVRIESPLSTFNSFVYSLCSYNNSNILKKLTNTGQKNFTKDNTIYFNFTDDNKIYIEAQNGSLLTSNGTGNGSLLFSIRQYPPSPTQLFDYFITENNITFFASDTNYQKIVIQDNSTNSLILSSTSLKESDAIPDSAKFKLISYVNNPANASNALADSYLVKYVTNPLTEQNSLVADLGFTNSNPLVQNYLGLFPVEYPQKNDFDASYTLQFHGLKNYQTPEYNYTTATPYISSSNAVRRLYNRIYTGTNQIKGYDHVYLGYTSDTKQYTFKVNQENIFYFPSVTNSLPLSSSGLIEDGATAGEVPFTSDRVLLYRQDYQEVTPGVPQPKNISRYDRTWLCSWLSGSNLGNKIWLDRYYNASYYTLDQALTAKTMVYNEKIDPSKPFTYDVPSTITFEPGILYKYERAGKSTSQEFIKHLDFDPNESRGAKLLSITNWLSSPLRDDSAFHNDGLVFFNNPENFKGNYWTLDGTNHAVFPSRTSLLNRDRFTVSFWLNVDDWSNIYGDQIFGNYYDSGFGLINQSSLTSPIFTILNNASAAAYNMNYKFIKLSESPIPYNNIDTSYDTIQRLPDYNYWVFDSKNLKGIKYNAINNIVNSLSSFSLSSYISAINQIEIDQNQNFYFYDNTSKKYVVTDSSGKFKNVTSLGINSGINRIEIDKDSSVVTSYGSASVIDNSNNLWEVVGGNLYKNSIIYANVGPTQQLTCDASNNIWLAHNQDMISKLDTINNIFVFSYRIGRLSSLPLDFCNPNLRFRYLNFVKVPKDNNSICNNSVIYEDRLIVVDTRDNEIYILNENGSLLSKLDLRAVLADPNAALDFYAKGDFTGYQYLRKFGGTTKNLSWKLKIAQPNGKDPQYLSLDYSVDTLPPGWHHFSLVFNCLDGYVYYYIDSILVAQKTFTPRLYQLYYDYRSSLLLGAATVRNTTLNDIIGIDDGYKFIGSISDLRMYSKSLTQGEIEQIYFSSNFADARKDLNWNMRVGNRSFIEEIEHWYKMQLPGSKSKYFNINIHNLNINDECKAIIEDSLKTNIQKLSPAETSLYKINWMQK